MFSYQNAEQEAEQLQGRTDVGEVGLVRLDRHEQFVKPGQLELGRRPHLGPQRHLQEGHATPREQLARRPHGGGRLVHLGGGGSVWFISCGK